MTRSQLTTFLIVLGVMDGLLIGVIVGATVSPLAGVVLGVGSGFALWGFVALIGRVVSRTRTWRELRRRYPVVEEDVFGSGTKGISMALRWSWMQLNNCVEARADEGHLHLRLALPGTGEGCPVSIPWEAVRSIEHGSFSRAKLDVEGLALWVPRVLVKEESALRVAMEDVAAVDGLPNS